VIGDGDAEEAQLALRRLGEEHIGTEAELDDEDVPTGEPVNVDDVLDMHGFLSGFDGDFQALFRRR
jgi:hypothetical protein